MEIIYHDEPFKIKELPLTDIHVIDNWLSPDIHNWFDEKLRNTCRWNQNNQVTREGEVRHKFWGVTFYRENYQLDEMQDHGWWIRTLDNRLQQEFGFRWKRFDYAGMNGQTLGLQGTVHEDCAPEDDRNLSFLWYNNLFWKEEWGGPLRIYNENARGFVGFSEDLLKHQILEVPYKPNRLLVFDGRIPHSADAPVNTTYHNRQSLVIRGSEVELYDESLEYATN